MTLGAFLCVLRLRDENGQPVEQLSALSGLSQSRPALAAALAFFMFSLAGIPPFLGFWSKLAVFIAAIHAGLIWLSVIGILGTVVGAYYYIKIVKILYFDAPAAPLGKVRAPLEGALIAMLAIFISPLGYLLIGPITRLTGNAASSLF
jgi:NADH-quinone oxidoreductase subunit N